MKRKLLFIVLGCEAVLCLLLYSARDMLAGVFSAVLAFPFEQVGLGLRALSLAGPAGNAAAVAAYVLLCLTPAAALLLLRRRRRLRLEDSLLAILSAVLFAVLYFMINPGLLVPFGGSAAGKAVLGGIVYSLLCGYAVLRILRLFYDADTEALQRYLARLLCLLAALFVYLAFGACFGRLLDAFDALRAGNAGHERQLGVSYVFLVLQFLADALPYLLDVAVIISALNLLRELTADRYSRAAVISAHRLSRLCGLALAVSVLSNMGFNLLQLIFFRSLHVINGTVQLPVLSVAFVSAVLLLARLIGENKRLKDDNDMFI